MSDLIAALIAVGTPDDLNKNVGAGNLAIWLSFIGVMFTAGVTVIVAAFNRGQRKLHADHANVQVILGEMRTNQTEIRTNQENFVGDIEGLGRSISKVHERLDVHLEHHNERPAEYRQELRVADGD